MRVRRTQRLIRDTAADFLTGLPIYFAEFALAGIDSRQAWPASANVGPNQALYTSELPYKDALTVPIQQNAISDLEMTEFKIAGRGAFRAVNIPLRMERDNRMVAIAMMALFFASVCAMTLGFWQHIRCEYAYPQRK